MNSICAGIVMFNPDIERLRENVLAIAGQVDRVIRGDNGSDNISEIKTFLHRTEDSRIQLFQFDENKGIACALNRICTEAADQAYRWVVTLDQDSVCPSHLVREFSKYIPMDDVALICPVIKDRNREGSGKTEPLHGFKEVDRCITSGSMLSLSDWRMIGGFDESMFIDGVDFDLCIRLRKNGKKIIRVYDVELLHELGNIKMRKFLFWDVIVKNHSSFRKFYIARNTIYLARKNKSSMLKARLQIIKQLLICLLYEKDKRNKCREILKGAREGSVCAIT